MWQMLFGAGLLSLDSLVVSVALSPLLRSPRQRWFLAALFGLCDGLAVVLGVAWRFRLAPVIAPIFALVFGAYFLAPLFWNKFRADLRLVFILPLLLSLDNFAYGIESREIYGPVAVHAVVLGLVSFALAALGLFAGSHLRFSGARASQSFAGFALFTCGLLLLLA